MMISSMEGIIELIMGTDYPDLGNLLPKLDKLTEMGNLLINNLPKNEDPLNILPTTHSIGYLYILLARLSVPAPDLITLLPFVSTFTSNFNKAQLTLIPEKAIQLFQLVQEKCMQAGHPEAAISPLRALVGRLGNTPGIITPLHVPYLIMCIECRRFDDGAEIAFYPTDIDVQEFSVKYQDILLYHYHSATIFGILGYYKEGIEALEFIVSAPGNGVSAVQVDAYKKLVLFQLLANGKMSSVPKYTATAVSTAIKNHCAPYSELAAAYAELDHPKFIQVADRFKESFERDYNYGLIIRCADKYPNRMIQNLTKTFERLSLVRVTSLIGYDPKDLKNLEGVKTKLIEMFHAKDIYGSIETVGGEMIVTFTANLEIHNSHATIQKIAGAIGDVRYRESLVAYQDGIISRSKDFVQKAYNSSAAVQQSSGMAITDDLDATEEWQADFED